ncbi:MAG: substrate-binding domain-containing protein, partial [Cellulomonadaceae bacterium]|nr:substrate-binding domain-containing protein [Cellulomonadaceae bacterium]
RALKSGRSMTLGVVLAGSGLFELPRVLLGMEQAASEAGYGVALARWQGRESEPLEHAIGRVTDRGADGVIVIADRPVAVDVLEEIRVRSPLTVVMSGDVANPSVGSVEIDQRLGARLVTQHLIDLGHTEILHISGRLDTFDARARVAGWTQSMHDAGLEAGEVIEGDFTPERGHQIGEELAHRGRHPTAVFAANDIVALGVMASFAESGLRVPQDVSVVGFDDMPGAAYFVPALTTVRQDHLALGRRAVDVLLGMITGEEPRHHLIEPTLVVRHSTGPVGHDARRPPAEARRVASPPSTQGID